MFNNASQEILKTELQKVDLFHLTWYWFKQNKLLSYTVGILQILSGILLVINRTVLIGTAIALPIFFNIFLIDWYCTGMPELTIRVFLYILLLVWFCYYRKEQILSIVNIVFSRVHTNIQGGYKWYQKLLWLILFLAALLIAEFILDDVIALIIRAVF